MLNFMKKRLRLFANDTRGYVTLEAIIVLPVMLWLFGVGWVYFDVFRQQSVNQKTNYVISDMISRETNTLDSVYIDNAYNLLKVMTRDSGFESDLRVTVVQFDADQDRWTPVWSQMRSATGTQTAPDELDYAERLPVAVDGEQLIVVETWDDYDPIFDVGLNRFDIKTYSFTRPRYTPQVAFGGASGTIS